VPDSGLILQHGESGPPGIFGEWLRERGLRADVHRVWSDPLPDRPEEAGWICSLGSEHTPGSPKAPAWAEAEVDFLSEALAADVPVLGLCFGGQALAAAARASIVASQPPEVGWQRVSTAEPDLVPPGPWLHFHFDAFEPPAAGRLLAWSAAAPAAFLVGRSLGVQFHPEATPAMAATWARLDAKRLAEIGIRAEDLNAQGIRSAQGAAAAARSLFDAWWAIASR
jgi:GMP synthase-like glutamine amidotransferase